ncbi:hypothetical protein GCM10011344_25990 [Dokdonia pacifica]|uniref:Por secretion system C-terminal sorting domain-containing protein n=1 Tax=Dokdonia pacifica TaxID=1627892 RepID=A0A238WVL5_9FLAO|nr:hypothetical protein [Dokdonia pacifica]GGG24039.1 hypothetical protein GCM10011344_25990 [Dokdonia pacifica]SNR49669.1 hypothetical protein SAMN06265376_1011456 [Dokdonia pacifica]
MKNTLKLSLLFALLITSVHVNATTLETFVETKESNPKTITDDLVIREKDEKVSVILLNLDLNPIKITIRDGFGRIVFSETIKDNKTIHKSFNFKKAYKGSYSIKVRNGLTTYNKEIKII